MLLFWLVDIFAKKYGFFSPKIMGGGRSKIVKSVSGYFKTDFFSSKFRGPLESGRLYWSGHKKRCFAASLREGVKKNNFAIL